MLSCIATRLLLRVLSMVLVVVAVRGLAQAAPAATNVPPATVGKVSQEDWNAYCKWMATLPADQLAWEKMLQKHLGDYYFPVYLKQRLAGGYTLAEPDDWGFVQDDPALPRVLLIGDSISHRKLNETADAVMARHNVKVDDLYSTVADSPDKYLCSDRIHYNSEGIRRQAGEAARVIAEALQARK